MSLRFRLVLLCEVPQPKNTTFAMAREETFSKDKPAFRAHLTVDEVPLLAMVTQMSRMLARVLGSPATSE